MTYEAIVLIAGLLASPDVDLRKIEFIDRLGDGAIAVTPGKKIASWSRLSVRVVLTTFLAVAGSGCESRYGMERSGMADPGRTDAEPVKVIVGTQRYIVPANCFSSPINASHVVGGYAVQQAILVTFLYPTGECKTKDNYKAFRARGYGSAVTLLIGEYHGLRPRQALGMYLVRTIEPNHYTGRRIDLPRAYAAEQANDEEIWHTNRGPGDESLPAVVHSDRRRTYAAHCSTNSQNLGRLASCSIIIYARNKYMIDFAPAMFVRRRNLMGSVLDKVREISVRGEM